MGTVTARIAALARALFATSIYSNYVWSVLNLVVSKGLRFAGVLICIRLVGMASWGEVAAALVTVGLMALAMDQGLSGTPQVYRVQDRGLDRPLAIKISLYRLAVASALIAALHAASAAIPIAPLVLLYSWVLLPRALNIDWLFHRREQYHVTMAIGSVRTLVFFALAAAVMGKGATGRTVIAIEMLSEAAGILFSYGLAWRSRSRAPAPASPLSLRDLLLFSLPILLTGILDSLPGAAEIKILQWFSGYEAVGQYDIGAKVGMFYFFFGAALIQIILPKLARLHAQGDESRMVGILSASSRLLLLVTAVLVIPSFYFPAEMVEFAFGNAYPLTVFVFRWIPVWVFVCCITMLNTIVLLGTGRRREYLYGAAVACAVNVAGNWVLIGMFGGHGVVFARILSESVLGIYAFLRLPPAIRSGIAGSLAVQVLALAGLVALVLVSLRFEARWACLAASVALCAGVVARQGTLGRETWKVFSRN